MYVTSFFYPVAACLVAGLMQLEQEAYLMQLYYDLLAYKWHITSNINAKHGDFVYPYSYLNIKPSDEIPRCVSI